MPRRRKTPVRYWYGPLEGGGWGVFDRAVNDWVAVYKGRRAERRAFAKCFKLAGAK
jgi:hypothetical protein